MGVAAAQAADDAPPEEQTDYYERRLPEQMGALPVAKGQPGPWMWSGAATNTAFSGPWGVSYAAKDVLGIAGTGPGALGFYKAGSERYRVFTLLRADEDSAKDVLKTLRKLDGAKALKDTLAKVRA